MRNQIQIQIQLQIWAAWQNASTCDPLAQITNSDVLYTCLQHPGVLGEPGDHAVDLAAVERRLDQGLVVEEVDRAPGHLESLVPVTVTHVVMGFTLFYHLIIPCFILLIDRVRIIKKFEYLFV